MPELRVQVDVSLNYTR